MSKSGNRTRPAQNHCPTSLHCFHAPNYPEPVSTTTHLVRDGFSFARSLSRSVIRLPGRPLVAGSFAPSFPSPFALRYSSLPSIFQALPVSSQPFPTIFQPVTSASFLVFLDFFQLTGCPLPQRLAHPHILGVFRFYLLVVVDSILSPNNGGSIYTFAREP